MLDITAEMFKKMNVPTRTEAKGCAEKAAIYDRGAGIFEPEKAYSWGKACTPSGAATEECEMFYMLTMDAQNHIKNAYLVSEGVCNKTGVQPQVIWKRALLDDAASILLIHNHPSGNASPSEEDIAITRMIAAGCKILGIGLLDHLIVTWYKSSSICRMYPEIFEGTLTKE